MSEERHPEFPNAVQAILLVLSLFISEQFIGTVLYASNGVLGLSMAGLAALTAVLANGLVLTGVLQLKGLSHAALIHPSQASRQATFWLLLPPILCVTPALVLVLGLLNIAVEQALPMSADEARLFAAMAEPSVANLLMGCLLAPVLEELLFRGVVLRSFLRLYPRGVAIGWSAILFGAAHLNVYQFVAATVMGALNGWLYERTRSLLPCITLHAAFNTTITVLSMVDLDDESSLSWLTWCGVGLAALWGAWVFAKLLARRAD